MTKEGRLGANEFSYTRLKPHLLENFSDPELIDSNNTKECKEHPTERTSASVCQTRFRRHIKKDFRRNSKKNTKSYKRQIVVQRSYRLLQKEEEDIN